jgi:hypothetical protein
MVGRPGGSAAHAVVPPVDVHAELSAVRHDDDRLEARGERGDPGNPRIGAAVGTMEEPENGIAAFRARTVAVRQQDMDLRNRTAVFERAAGSRGVDQRARELERDELGARRADGRKEEEAQHRPDEKPMSTMIGSAHAAIRCAVMRRAYHADPEPR